MFRSSRWRGEKNKIKTVFKLQFHATQLPQLNVNALVLSVVPGDAGKPTVSLEKGILRQGSCRWDYPVHETVKYIRDVKTGKINERIYHFVVSTGSSKNSLVGEVSIDFADYAEATKASTVSLPFKNSKSNGVLHVSIQRLQENVEQSEVMEGEDANVKSQSRTLNTLLSNSNIDEGIDSHSSKDGPLINGAHTADLNVNDRTSSGSDITMSSSETSSGLNTPRELGLRNNMLQDPISFLSSQTQTSAPHLSKPNAPAANYGEHRQQQWELSADSDHGTSTDDSTNSSQGNLTRERSQQVSDMDMEKLKAELVMLSRQADVSEMEIQTLRKQIIKESKRGQDLSREILGLKGERDMLKSECEKLKAFQKCMEEARSKNKSQFEGGDPWVLLEEVRQELNYEKDLNSNLRLQLQKTQESNAELILAVKDLDEMLEQKSKGTSDLSNKARSYENAISRSETDDDEDQKALEELVKEHKDAKETYLLEQKIMDLCSEIEIYRRDRDELEMQMEQLALDYEILKQENHDMSYKLEQSQLQEQLKMQYECSPLFHNINEQEAQIESLENELKMQSEENFDSLATIKELETHIKSLEEELEKQAQEFEADLEAVTRARVEQEKRAIQAEEAMRKTRLKNANAAEKLQEEFRRLSMQMASTFDANEKVAMKALAEASELRMQKVQLEEMLQKANEELQSITDGYESKLHDLSNQLNLKMHQIEQMMMEIEDKSRVLEQLKKLDEERAGASSQEIQGLKTELEMLAIENNNLLKQAEHKESMSLELEQMKTSIKHTGALVQKGDMEQDELVGTISLLKKEAEKSLVELNRMRCLKDEKEAAMNVLQSEVGMLKAQCDNLKHSVFEDELEKEKLRKQLVQLKSELKKKEDALNSMEKKIKESSKRSVVSEGTKTNLRNNKSAPVPYGSKEVANLREKIKLLEGQIKLKETALEASASSFAEKERDLQNKIEELVSRLEELNQNSAIFCYNQPQKVSDDDIGVNSNGDVAEDYRKTDENPSSSCKENGNSRLLIKSDHSTAAEQEPKASCCINNTDHNAERLLSELVTLKERNKSMENELKEMQERYSEISLKFAEVEGERQQLVMTLRNLKNARKS
ncbi:PREDICTED: myosin-11 [Populus euphratica]|uniref:Myosin-11 n=1 Tax=Populus euphratica TaxID=75702 RepID=A0AAJ6U3Q8_POPEU|nr:PREDICTED: myosin-11 [Populus euphratica]